MRLQPIKTRKAEQGDVSGTARGGGSLIWGGKTALVKGICCHVPAKTHADVQRGVIVQPRRTGGILNGIFVQST